MSRVRIDPSSRLPLSSDGALAPRSGGPTEGGAIDAELAKQLFALKANIASRKTRYVELQARTNFSFLSGATPPDVMVRHAAELGYDVLAITDRDGLYGIVRAYEAAKEAGLRIIVGCELTLESEGLGLPEIPGKPNTLTVLVENHEGYKNLCKILTESHARHPRARPSASAEADDVDIPKNLFAGVPLSFVCRHAAGLWALADAVLPIDVLSKAFGKRLSIAVHLHKDGEDRARVTRTLEAHRRHGVPVCATGRVLFARASDKPIFDVLHCIREGLTLDEAGRELLPNAEAHLKSEEEMDRLFSLHPEWLGRSRFIADHCRFGIQELSYKFPYELTDLIHRDFHGAVGETADQALARLTWVGAQSRYGDAIPDRVRLQVDKELTLIRELQVAPYFLSVRAIIDMARKRDILCQGRGSAANSAVCFCLGITAVDPARSDMLFERFLSADRRGEPPDIDVDFEHERREEVIQEIYETYGRHRAAMVSEVVSYRSKSALREVGKVFGLSLEQVERLAGVVSWWDGVSAVSESRLRAIGFSGEDPGVRQVLILARAIQGFPRHLSIHVGGFVLSATDLTEVAPVEPATMKDRTIVPWDKDDIDVLGFFKVDVLGLGMLTALRKCLDLVRDVAPAVEAQRAPGSPVEPYVPEGLRTGSAIDRLACVPPEEKEVYDALCEADTVGVFQIESRAQMSMLPRLRPRRFYDLVVEVAIVRPGPIHGGMIHPFLRRRTGEESIEAPHPLLEPILERTLGVPLFQEQVMQIAIAGAGYSGGEADQLRRDMASWRKNGKLEGHRERLLEGFRQRDIPLAFGERLYEQIKGFGEYGFPESHASSFALLVYASAWLKVHHPAEFAAALVNSQPMGFYSPSTILQDAQRHGVVILPVDVQTSEWDCACLPVSPEILAEHAMGDAGDEEGESRPVPTALRLGFRVIGGLGQDVGRRIVSARGTTPFASVEDLASRAGLEKKELVLLAESGALDALSGSRRDAIWKVVLPRAEDMWNGQENGEPRASLGPMPRAEQLVLDYERTGISVADHPMKIVRPRLPKRTASSREVLALASATRVRTAGLVICRQRPATASGVVFVTMEDEFGFINLVVWSSVFEKFRHVTTTSRLLLASGRIERSDEPRKRKGEIVVDKSSGGDRRAAPLPHITAESFQPALGTSKRPTRSRTVPSSVVYVVVDRLDTLDDRLPAMVSASRDFH